MLCQNLQLEDELVNQAVRLVSVNNLDELVNLALRKLVTSLQVPLKSSVDLEAYREVETSYRIQPVTLGAKLPNLDNIHEVLAIAEGEAYR